VQHRLDRFLSKIRFAYDHERLYIAVEFVNRNYLAAIDDPSFLLTFFTPQTISIRLPANKERMAGGEEGKFKYCFGDILEVAVERTFLWPNGFGRVGFRVAVLDKGEMLESRPESEPIQLEVFEREREIFWPT
jgi:hypothetical protein